jgi:hypothetical protein
VPTLSTWIIVAVATSLNVASYLVAPRVDVLSGVLGLTDTLVSWLILIVTVRTAGFKLTFQTFEKYYLIGAGCIVLFWIISRDAFLTNLLMQVLLTIGCSSTIQSLLYAKENHESFIFWGLGLIAVTLSLYPAAVDGNLLAVLYSLRSIVIVCVILSLMLRLHRNTRTKRRPEILP